MCVCVVGSPFMPHPSDCQSDANHVAKVAGCRVQGLPTSPHQSSPVTPAAHSTSAFYVYRPGRV